MQISINTSEATKDELTALIALCASLGGRLPAVGETRMTIQVDKDDATQDIRSAFEEHAETNLGDESDIDTLASRAAGNTPAPRDDAVDSSGLPWDERIHSESKAINADGSWRKRRGVDDATYQAVLAELQGDAPPPPPPAADEGKATTDDAPPPPPPSAPTEAAPSEPEPAANAPAAGSGQFDGFPAFVSAVSKHGKSYAELNELAGMVGIAAFKDMKDHPDQWDAFFAMLG